MLRKIVLNSVLATILTPCFAQGIYSTMPTTQEAIAFKKGFQLAVMSLKDGREYKIQGKEEEEVQTRPYMVLIDTTDLDDADKMAIQKIGFIYAESTRLKGNKILMASFEEKPNAVTLAKNLNRDYFSKNAPHRRAYVYEKRVNETFYKEKSLFSRMAEMIETDLKNSIPVIYIKDKTPTIQPKAVEKKETPKEAPKTVSPIAKKVIEEQKPTQKNIAPASQEPAIKTSHTNKEPIYIQFFQKGKYTIQYKLSATATKGNIGNSDLIKDKEIENDGTLLTAQEYLVTKEGIKYYKSDSGHYYLEANIEIINNFTEE